MKVLFLTAWYPNRNDDMEGLFVRKHARAVALSDDVHVLFLKPEPSLKSVCYDFQTIENVNEHILYYPGGRNRISKMFLFLKIYRIGLKKVLHAMGKPDIVHAHILTRHGLAALLISLRYGIPYVITEHWSRYYRQEFSGRMHRKLTRIVVRRAKRVMPVSESLASAMQACGLNGNYTVVRNVVDDYFFLPPTPPDHGSSLKTMIHICCFDEPAKNNYGLLRALKTLSLVRSDFRMVFVGDGKDREATQDYARLLNFKAGQIIFKGKLQPREVKQEIDRACFMVLFSNYETASVVICENLACGKPVVATQTGGIPEIVNPSNGILLPPCDEQALWQAIDRMLNHYEDYPAEKIRQSARIFSFRQIGTQLHHIYLQSLNS